MERNIYGIEAFQGSYFLTRLNISPWNKEGLILKHYVKDAAAESSRRSLANIGQQLVRTTMKEAQSAGRLGAKSGAHSTVQLFANTCTCCLLIELECPFLFFPYP